MSSFTIQKWCVVCICVLVTLKYIESFRLIHTSQQSHETRKANIKELTKKLSALKHGKDTFLNDSVTLHFETLKKPNEEKKEAEDGTVQPNVKKIKTIQPALPLNVSKQHILHRFKAAQVTTKSDVSDKMKFDKSEEFQSEEEIQLPASVEKSEPRNKTAKTVITKLKEYTKSAETKDYDKPVEKKEPIKSPLKESKHVDESKVSIETKRTQKKIDAKEGKDKDDSESKLSTTKSKVTQTKQDAKTLIREGIQKITAGKIKEPPSKSAGAKLISTEKSADKKELPKKEVKPSIEKKTTPPSSPKLKTQSASEKSKAIKDVKLETKTLEQPKSVVTPKKTTEKTLPPSKPTKLYFNLPSFALNFDAIENDVCKKQGQSFIDQLNKRKLWALKMIDSTAKLPSGILKGNLNQFGDYDQCVNIFVKLPNGNKTSSDMKISGKYCLADIDIETKIQEMKLPVHMAQGRALIRSKNQDPGHFAPRFTTIRWAMCIPSACTAQDAELFLEDSLKDYNEVNTGLNLNVSVKPEQCSTKKLPKKVLDLNSGVLISIVFVIILMITVLIATIRDVRLEENEVELPEETSTIEKVFMSFSLKKTISGLLKSESEPDEIECIHGIRTICTFMLYLGHRLIPIGHIPFTNKIYLTEVANHPLSMLLRVSVIYTDSFLLLSGVLTSYRMSKDMESKGHIPWFNRIFARYVRLTPSLIIVLLYYAYIMELVGDGPLWNTIVTPNARLCQENGWKNLLYIQNIYPFQDMCATHTHQLALDMQLSLVAPILVWLLYRRPFMGVVTTLLFHCISVILRYYTTINYRLSLIIYHGISLSQLYRTANLLYASSVHRATPYLAGVGLGVLLRQMNPDFHMPKVKLILRSSVDFYKMTFQLLAIFGWLIAGYFGIWTFYTPSHLASRSYQYDLYEAAQYAALCSLAWSLALSWIIFASFADSKGKELVLYTKNLQDRSYRTFLLFVTCACCT